MRLRGDSSILSTKRTVASFLLAVMFIFCIHTVTASAKHKAAQQPSQQEQRFAFWYEEWKPGTWEKLQPATHVIGVPVNAVAEIHEKNGRAIHYVTFYQAAIGTAFLSSKDDLAAVGFHTPQGYLPSVFDRANKYVLCSNSRELRNRILSYVNQALKTNKYDGFFIDNTYLPPATTLVCDANHAHVTPGADGGSAYLDLLKDVYSAVKRANPSAVIVTNPGTPTSVLTNRTYSLWDFSDYILWESYGYTSASGSQHDDWPHTIRNSFAFSNPPKVQKILVLSYPKTDAEAFYSYAVASAFGFKYTANLGVSEQRKEGTGGHYGIFTLKLPQLVGLPTDAPPKSRDIILQRSYTNGVCIVNLRKSDYSVVLQHSGTLYRESGSSKVGKGQRYSLPPNTASILIF